MHFFPCKPISSAFVAAAIVASLSPPPIAQPTNDAFWDLHFGLPGPVAQEPDYRHVSVIELAGDEIYLGGSFQGITDVLAPGIAHWDGTKWESLGTGVEGGGVVAILIEGTDVYVGGSFFSAGGIDAPGVAKWDGSAWSALGDGIDIGPYASFQATSLIRYNGQLHVGGWKQVDHMGSTVPIFAKWDGTTWTSHVPSDYYGGVYCMKTDGAHLYLGGTFATPFSFPYLEDAVLRWDGTTLATMGDGLIGSVRDLDFFNGQLHAVGSIYNSGVVTIRDIAAWNGTSWYEIGGGVGTSSNARLSSVASRNGLLYVAGDFDKVGSVNSNDLAWWDGNQWHAYTGPPIGMSAFGNSLSTISLDDENLFVSGYFTRVAGVVTYGLARWDGVNWFSLSDTEQYGTNEEVRALEGDGNGGLYAGGDFAYAGNTATGCVAFFDGSEWHALGGGLSGGFLGVWALEHSGTDLWAGGRFTNAGGVDVKNLARWDGTAWYDVGGGLSGGSAPLVMSIHAVGSDLYVGGIFTQAGAIPAAHIAKWDGTSWQALGSGTNGAVLETIVWNGLLYAGGNFTIAGGAPAEHVASWDGSSWAQIGAGFNSGVNAFAVFNGELYASGSFSNSGGQPMIGIAKWNGSEWVDVGGSLGSQVNDIEVVENGIFACGPFQTAGGSTAKRIAKWTGTQWETLGTGVGPTFVNALAAVDNFIYVGGDFSRAGDKAVSYLARWDWVGQSTDVDPVSVIRAGLGNCVPNPFNPSTTIPYSVATAGRVTLKVYDVGGRYVRTLVDRDHATSKEMFTASWDGRDDAGQAVASGVYFCRMVSGSFTDTRKMVLLK
jgi:trimeric autotransporter adhesin